MTALKIAVAAAFMLLGILFADDVVEWTLTLVAALGLGAFALRDVIAPVRLAADTEGVTVVRGFAGRHRLRWPEIERIRVDERPRMLSRSAVLEIDAGSALYFLGQSDLGVPPAEAVDTLNALRADH